MKRLLFLSLVLILLLSLFGCASAQATTTGAYAPAATTAAGKNKGATADQLTGEMASDSSGSASVERKIVKNAALSLEAKDVAAVYDELLAYATQHGGYETSRNQRTVGGVITIEAQIKIKPAELDGFLAFAGTKADIISSQTSTSDITEAYYDAQIRLDTMEKSLQTYYSFLSKAKDINESLAVQNQINQLTQQIEALKGKIKLWDSLLAESTVTLSIRQIVDPVKTKKEINWSTLTFEDMGYLMQAGLTGLLNILANVLQWTAIILVVTLPIWIPTLAAILLIRRRNKKRRAGLAAAQREAAPAEPEEKPPEEPRSEV